MADWKKDSLFSVVLFGISVYVYIATMNMPSTSAEFPRLLTYPLAIISIVLLIQSLLKRKQQQESSEQKNKTYPLILALIVLMIVYSLALNWLGYLLSTTLLYIFIIFLLGYKRIVAGILSSFVLMVFIYFIFKVFLSVPLPSGIFF